MGAVATSMINKERFHNGIFPKQIFPKESIPKGFRSYKHVELVVAQPTDSKRSIFQSPNSPEIRAILK